MLANGLSVQLESAQEATVVRREVRIMEWTREQTLVLIDLYRSHPVLWDNKLSDYKNKLKKAEAWRTIAVAMEIERAEVERKIRILTTQFRREVKKMKKEWMPAGDGTEDVYKASWFAFESLSFLIDKMKPQGPVTHACLGQPYYHVSKSARITSVQRSSLVRATQ